MSEPTQLPETVVTATRLPATGSGAPAGNVTAPDPVASAGASASAAPINDPSGPQSAIRQPLLKVITNGGAALVGVVSAECENNAFYGCDHFHLTFAASAGEPGWFDYEPPLILDTHFSLDQGHSWTSLLIGEVDKRVWSPETGTVTLEGRDLFARLIEMKIQEAFVNWTSSQVVTELAKRTDLIPVVTPTTVLVGRYYEADHVEGGLDQFARTTTAWDLCVYLAQREGYDVFVEGTVLHFQPSTTTECRAFRYSLAATWADTTVECRHVARRTLRYDGEGHTGSSAELVKPTRPGLANQLAIDLTKHERVISIEMHGDLTLTPRHLVRLEGTQTSWDQTYYVDEIHRSLSFNDGFHQTLRLKNSSPRSMVQLS